MGTEYILCVMDNQNIPVNLEMIFPTEKERSNMKMVTPMMETSEKAKKMGRVASLILKPGTDMKESLEKTKEQDME